jgi:Ca2+-binding RTX toxin-like protein
MNRTLVSLALMSALVGALTLAATGRSGTPEPASCVFLERGVKVRDARTSTGCTDSPNGDIVSLGAHQHLQVWHGNRPDIKIEDLEGIETVDLTCSQESPTVVVCPHRESISINGYGARDFIRFRGAGAGTGAQVTADGGSGVDKILGGRGHQRMWGGSRDDTMEGRRGHDYLNGKEGDDLVRGGRGTDRLQGGQGDDLLNGKRGDDRCTGGSGDDRVRRCEARGSAVPPS